MIGLLFDSSIRIAVLTAAVALILLVMRVRSSTTRHAAWTTVLVAMLSMPLLLLFVPVIPIPSPLVPTAFDVWPDRAQPDAPLAEVRATASAPPPIAAAPSASTGARSTAPLNRTVPAAWPGVALLIYLAGVVILLLRLVVGCTLARRIRGSAMPIALQGDLVASVSPRIATPITLGLLHPRIVLPMSWRTWDAETLRAVIAHERAHIRRRDPLVAFLARLNSCLFWFHPLAWWLDRTLAVTAEHACDDEAVRAVGERRRYAEVLLEMAEAVRRSGGRVAWQGIGVDGNGRLGARIDRVLLEEPLQRLSRTRVWAVFGGCALAIVLAVACRQELRAAPLREDPETSQRLREQKTNEEFYNAAREMTAAQADALESGLAKNPNDLPALKKLRSFYQSSGQKVFGWNEMIARRRPLVLRLIDQYPEDEVAAWHVSRSADPATYDAAKAHWLAQAGKPGATAKSLTNAAQFIEQDDPQVAEELLLRARTIDPEGETLRYRFETPRPAYWSRRLGSFYGRAIAGPRSPKDGRPLQPLDADAYTRDLRARLAASDDAPMLGAAGTQLVQASYFDPAREQLGRQFLERALQIDPAQLDARRGLLWADDTQRNRRMRELLRAREADLAGGEVARRVRAGEQLSGTEGDQLRAFEYEAASSLPEADRLFALGDVATSGYLWAEHFKDDAVAKGPYERAKKAGHDALTLSSKLREHPDYAVTVYRANIALGTHALREGDRAAAVRYMLDAVSVPASDRFALGDPSFLSYRLVNYLLKYGERESVAQFLERSGELRTSEKSQLLKDAAAIRAGVMPRSYQYMVAREQ